VRGQLADLSLELSQGTDSGRIRLRHRASACGRELCRSRTHVRYGTGSVGRNRRDERSAEHSPERPGPRPTGGCRGQRPRRARSGTQAGAGSSGRRPRGVGRTIENPSARTNPAISRPPP
jgi:hypothetical protein